MDAQPLDIEQLEPQISSKEFLSLFLGLKWAIIVLCVSVVTSILVAPWFLVFGSLFSIALFVSDTRVAAVMTKRLTKLLDSEYDELEQVFGEIKPQLGSHYAQLLAQAMDIYREIKAAIRERGLLAESFSDVFPAIQVLMDKILHLTKKAQLIDNGLRCHDDVEHTRMVLDHYQQKIEQDRADDFIRAEWIRTRDSLIKQLRSQEEIQRGKEYVQSKLTNIITSLREVHLAIIRLSFSDLHDGSDDLGGVFQTVVNLSEAIDDTVETLDKITYQQVE
jgi:hypothetical protein